MTKISKIFMFIHIKSIIVNLWLLPFGQAIKMPILVSRKTKIKSLKGKVIIKQKARLGMIQIGYNNVGIIDYKYVRSIIEINGLIIFNGTAYLGTGSIISVGDDGILEVGNNFSITAKSTIVCFKKITIGNDTVLSWENMILDTDFHGIYKNEIRTNTPEDIVIGNHVWIGYHCTILKGSVIPNNSVIASNSRISKVLDKSNSLYGGSPAKLLNSDISWGE